MGNFKEFECPKCNSINTVGHLSWFATAYRCLDCDWGEVFRGMKTKDYPKEVVRKTYEEVEDE